LTSLQYSSTIPCTPAPSPGSTCEPRPQVTKLTLWGVALLGEFSFARTSDRRTEAYVLGVGSIAHDGLANEAAFGIMGGFGLRHWLTPNLGFGVELGESYLKPIGGSVGSQSTAGNLDTGVLGTFGALQVAITL